MIQYKITDNLNTNQPKSTFFFIYKVFMLGITMQLDISAKLTPQETTIICHHMKKKINKN